MQQTCSINKVNVSYNSFDVEALLLRVVRILESKYKGLAYKSLYMSQTLSPIAGDLSVYKTLLNSLH